MLAGCSPAGTRTMDAGTPAKAQAAPVESGFLSDYAKLAPSEQFPDLRFYRDDSRKTGYRKILFRPVEVWRGADKLLTDVPEEDLQFLADSFYQAVHGPLAKSFEIVDAPGAGVLEIQLALTLVTDPESSVDFYSTTVPAKAVTPRSGALAPATKLFVRDCALEAEMSEQNLAKPSGSAKPPGDAKHPGRPHRVPRTVRAAFYDVRRGSQTPKGSVSTWEDVRGVFDRWAGVLDDQLIALRDGTFKPRLTTKAQRQ
jgi:hypothetical protein